MSSVPPSVSSPGQYEDLIAKLAAKYPVLASVQPFQWTSPGEYAAPARLMYYDFSSLISETGDSAPPHILVKDTTQLRALLQNMTLTGDDGHPRRLLFMLEGQHPDFVAALGESLELDPRLWTCYEGMLPDSTTQTRGQYEGTLPRIVRNTECFQLEYWQLMHLNLRRQRSLMRCAENERAIASHRIMPQESSFNPGAGQDFDDVGAVSRKVAFWSRTLPHGGWFGASPNLGRCMLRGVQYFSGSMSN